LDQWRAANTPASTDSPPYNTPAVADVIAEIASLLGNNLSASNPWSALYRILCEWFYAALILSAMESGLSLVDATSFLTRWLLVVGLVNDLQSNASPIQSPDNVYSALRWRTIVLPDSITSTLLSIRAGKRAVLARKPGFADLYITREEWDHYEAAEIASIENILGREQP